MSKDALSNWQQQYAALSCELETKQCASATVEELAKFEGQQTILTSQLSIAEAACKTAQISCQQATSALSQSLIENKTLNDDLQAQKKLHTFLVHLSDKYRKFEGITVNPAVVITEKLSAEELEHTDLLKVTCKEHCTKAFDLALLKLNNVNFQDHGGKTILMYAIINGFYYAADKLLKKGADVNLLDKQGANALFYCTQVPHVKYFKQIAEKTMDLNYQIPGYKNNSFLHSLIENSEKIIFASELNNEFKDCIIIFPSNINCVVDDDLVLGCLMVGERTNDGYTVTQEKTLYMIKYLIDKDLDINVKNDDGVTPFQLAYGLKLRYLSKYLKDHYPIDLKDHYPIGKDALSDWKKPIANFNIK